MLVELLVQVEHKALELPLGLRLSFFDPIQITDAESVPVFDGGGEREIRDSVGLPLRVVALGRIVVRRLHPGRLEPHMQESVDTALAPMTIRISHAFKHPPAGARVSGIATCAGEVVADIARNGVRQRVLVAVDEPVELVLSHELVDFVRGALGAHGVADWVVPDGELIFVVLHFLELPLSPINNILVRQVLRPEIIDHIRVLAGLPLRPVRQENIVNVHKGHDIVAGQLVRVGPDVVVHPPAALLLLKIAPDIARLGRVIVVP